MIILLMILLNVYIYLLIILNKMAHFHIYQVQNHNLSILLKFIYHLDLFLIIKV